MKLIYKSILVAFVAVAAISCQNSGAKNELNAKELITNPNSANDEGSTEFAVMTFENTSHDFGEVMRGEKVTYSYKFTNTGNADLLIAGVTASCGCTISEYPEEKVKPGKSDYVTVTFDSSGKKGFQNKKVTVMSNAQPSKNVLRVKAKVLLP
jgi:hypothetical protein